MNTNQTYHHVDLIYACEHGNINDVKLCLDSGADPNFNIKRPTNALYTAIKRDHHDIIKLLLDHGARVKEFVLQQAIEKDKNYLKLLIPNFSECRDKTLLMGALQAAINISDLELAEQAINQGAKPQSLVLSAIGNIESPEILQLLLENGLNIHAENNLILSEWMGSSAMYGGEKWKPSKDKILAFVFEYYLDKPDSIEKFKSLRVPDKKHLFLMGLHTNNFNTMKFALAIGADKSEALNSAHRQYNAYKEGNIGTIYATVYTNNRSGKVDYEIIEYILSLDIEFSKTTISRAVFFKYSDILNALNRMQDLEYGYEMAYEYKDENLCEYFAAQGVSKEAQNFAKMKVSAIKGDIKELHKVVNEGANVEALERDIIIEIINQNQIEILKYLSDSGVLLESFLNKCLDKAMNQHKAYKTISYLIELGFDITNIKNIPIEYKKKYPVLADIWQRGFRDIFDYTVHLAKEIYPSLEGKEKEETLQIIAELSSLPYVMKCSQGKAT